MKVIGIPLRYQHLSDGRCITYMSERLRRTFQLAGSYVFPIAPVQNVDYIDSKASDSLEFSDIEKESIEKSLDYVDGIVFPGGIKFTPYDRYLLERCIDRKIPVLGICLGMQLISCYKEDVILNQVDNHSQDDDNLFSHVVNINKDSILYDILGKDQISVNSFHKYCATENKIFKTVAYSEDSTIEAIEYPGDTFCLGIQWHPEISYEFDENSKKIIDEFIKRC